MMIVIGIIVAIIYLISPVYGKIAITIANFFIPDALPIADEILMVLGSVASIAGYL